MFGLGRVSAIQHDLVEHLQILRGQNVIAQQRAEQRKPVRMEIQRLGYVIEEKLGGGKLLLESELERTGGEEARFGTSSREDRVIRVSRKQPVHVILAAVTHDFVPMIFETATDGDADVAQRQTHGLPQTRRRRPKSARNGRSAIVGVSNDRFDLSFGLQLKSKRRHHRHDEDKLNTVFLV